MKKSYEDKSYVNLDQYENLSVEAKEKRYEEWRIKIEQIVLSKKNCASPTVSRRDFLRASCIIGAGSGLVIPSLVKSRGASIVDQAIAQASMKKGGVVTFFCDGGHNIAREFMVGARGASNNGDPRDYLSPEAYYAMGFNENENPAITPFTKALGMYFVPGSSLLAGIMQGAGTSYAKINDGAQGITLAGCATENDGGGRDDPHSAAGLIARMIGSGVSTFCAGEEAYPDAFKYAPAGVIPVKNARDTISLPGGKPVGFQFDGKASNNVLFNSEVHQAIKRISALGLAKLSNDVVPDSVKKSLNQNYDISYLSSITPDSGTNNPLDPTKAADCPTVFTLQANNPEENAAMTAAHLVTQNRVSNAIVELGGRDYHNQGAANANAKHLELGKLIGQTLQLACLRNVPCTVYIPAANGSTSQGARSAQDPLAVKAPTGDLRDHALGFAIFFDPRKAPELIAPDQYQIGAWQKASGGNQAVADLTATVFSNNRPDLAAAVFMANYAAFAGDVKLWENLKGSAPFDWDMIVANKLLRIKV